MSYRSLVKNGVKAAFRGIGDLAQEVTFVRYPSSTFDFSSGYEVGFPSLSTHRVFIEETKTNEKNIRVKTIYANTSEIPDIKFTESLTISSESWKIGKLLEHNDYVTKFEVFRER